MPITLQSALRSVLICGLVALCFQVASAGSQPTDNDAVTYQINSAHSGYASFAKTPFSPPFKILWSVSFGSTISYPVIAAGKVFVTVANRQSAGTINGAQLFVLDQATGNDVVKPIAIPATYGVSAAAYDNDELFVVDFGGGLRAFDTATVRLLWSIQLPLQYEFQVPPTPAGGILYVTGSGDGGTLYAVNEKTGAVTWSVNVSDGNSSPTIAGGGLFVSYDCRTYDYNRSTGSMLWDYNGPCSVGGETTTIYAGGNLYVPVPGSNTVGMILNATTGKPAGTFSAVTTLPAFAQGVGYFHSATGLEARSAANQSLLWSFTGDGKLCSAPIVVNNLVFVGSASGRLYTLDSATGQLLQTMQLMGAVANANQEIVTTMTGMGAGDGMLVVPTRTMLYAIVKK